MNLEYIKTQLYQLVLGDSKIQDDSIAINARHQDALQNPFNRLKQPFMACNPDCKVNCWLNTFDMRYII